MAPKTQSVPVTVPEDVLEQANGRPIVCAAGEFYIMKDWYRPGLPALRDDGELMVANEVFVERQNNLITILANIDSGSYNGIIPDVDLNTIQQQATHWLNLMSPKGKGKGKADPFFFSGPPPPGPVKGKGVPNNYTAPPTPKAPGSNN